MWVPPGLTPQRPLFPQLVGTHAAMCAVPLHNSNTMIEAETHGMTPRIWAPQSTIQCCWMLLAPHGQLYSQLLLCRLHDRDCRDFEAAWAWPLIQIPPPPPPPPPAGPLPLCAWTITAECEGENC